MIRISPIFIVVLIVITMIDRSSPAELNCHKCTDCPDAEHAKEVCEPKKPAGYCVKIVNGSMVSRDCLHGFIGPLFDETKASAFDVLHESTDGKRSTLKYYVCDGEKCNGGKRTNQVGSATMVFGFTVVPLIVGYLLAMW